QSSRKITAFEPLLPRKWDIGNNPGSPRHRQRCTSTSLASPRAPVKVQKNSTVGPEDDLSRGAQARDLRSVGVECVDGQVDVRCSRAESRESVRGSIGSRNDGRSL